MEQWREMLINLIVCYEQNKFLLSTDRRKHRDMIRNNQVAMKTCWETVFELVQAILGLRWNLVSCPDICTEYVRCDQFGVKELWNK